MDLDIADLMAPPRPTEIIYTIQHVLRLWKMDKNKQRCGLFDVCVAIDWQNEM